MTRAGKPSTAVSISCWGLGGDDYERIIDAYDQLIDVLRAASVKHACEDRRLRELELLELRRCAFASARAGRY